MFDQSAFSYFTIVILGFGEFIRLRHHFWIQGLKFEGEIGDFSSLIQTELFLHSGYILPCPVIVLGWNMTAHWFYVL